MLKYVQQCYVKWFWTISSLGALCIDCFSFMCELITMAGSNFFDRCKKYCRIGWWSNENHTYLFKICIKNILKRNIYNQLNRHIFKWNVEKETMLTASRRTDKFPTAGTDKMTNARHLPRGDGIDWAINYNNLRKFINEMASTRRWHLKPFTFRKLSSVRLFCQEFFSNKRNKRTKSITGFQQLAGVYSFYNDNGYS